MAIFDNDDLSYLTWINNFPKSYIANAKRELNSNYFVIHTTNCSTINGTKKDYVEDSFTRSDYIKVGTHHYHELIEWAKVNRKKSNTIKNCGICKPKAES